MKVAKRILRVFVVLFLAGCVASMATQPLSAQVTIPSGSTIDKAVFSIWADPNNQIIHLHRITADWGENSVTWNTFAESYDPLVIGSFINDSYGWHSVEVTALVQAWVSGLYHNYGILLEQGMTDMTGPYPSSENMLIELRPKLEIWYTTPSGAEKYAIIQRPGDAQDGVADAYIWQTYPDKNFNDEQLWTGYFQNGKKYALIRFHFTITPPGVGTGTPGYWKNHPDAWPVKEISIGGRTYTKEEAIRFMNMPVSNDKTFTMFNALVSAKLNVLIGNDDSCIADTIKNADIWMATYGPVGSGVSAGGSKSPWRTGEPLSSRLDAYNNGLLPCAQHRY